MLGLNSDGFLLFIKNPLYPLHSELQHDDDNGFREQKLLLRRWMLKG